MSPIRRIVGFLVPVLFLNAALYNGMKQGAFDPPDTVCEIEQGSPANTTEAQLLPETSGSVQEIFSVNASVQQGSSSAEQQMSESEPRPLQDLYANYHQMIAFNAEAAARHLRIQDTEPDGNCFYRAISQALGPDQSQHAHFRHLAVSELRSNRGAYMEFFAGPGSTESSISTPQEVHIAQQQLDAFNSFVTLQAQDRTWVDHAAIEALSRRLHRVIEVHQPNPLNHNEYIVLPFGNSDLASLESTEPIRVAYNRFNHYGSMYYEESASFENQFGLETLEGMMAAIERRVGSASVVTREEDLHAEYDAEQCQRVSEMIELMVGYSLSAEKIQMELGDKYALDDLLTAGLADLLTRPENEIYDLARSLREEQQTEAKIWGTAKDTDTEGRLSNPLTVTDFKAQIKEKRAFTPQRDQAASACRRQLLLLDQHIRDTGRQAAEIFTRSSTPQQTPQSLPVVSTRLTGINPDSAWRALHSAIVGQYDDVSADVITAALRPIRDASSTGETRIASGTVMDAARQVARDHFGDAGRFPDVSASIGVQDYAAGLTQLGIGAYLTHFPINDEHFAAQMSSRLASTSERTSPTYKHYFDDADYQFQTPTLCCSYFYMEAMIRSAQLSDILVTDLYPVVGHPRGGGLSSDLRRMEVGAAVLNSILREGQRVFRVASSQATISSLSLLEALQQVGGRHFDVNVHTGGSTVRVHVLTQVSLPASIHPVTNTQLPASEHPFTVILVGTDHVSMARFPHLVRGMLLADQVFAAFCGKTLTTQDMAHGARLFKGTGLSAAQYEESFNLFVDEENALQQAFILSLIAYHRFSMEQAVRTVFARRRWGYGLRCDNPQVAHDVAEELMARPDKPKGLRLEVDGSDILAVSVGRKRKTGESNRKRYPTGDAEDPEEEEEVEGEALRTLRRDDASWAVVAFSVKEKQGRGLEKSVWLKKRKLNTEESVGVEGQGKEGDEHDEGDEGEDTE